MAIVNFKCPNCGGVKLEEVMTDVTVSTGILHIWDEEDVEYDVDCENMGGVVDRYQCDTCGHVLMSGGKTIKDLVTLYIALDTEGMLVRIPEGEVK